jgi:hypothetical protein
VASAARLGPAPSWGGVFVRPAGVPMPRLEGDEYYDMVDEFMQAVFDRWPHVVVQFEDFESSKAAPLLQKYRHRYRCFNDDIQGTGCVTLAGVIAAARQAGRTLPEMSFMCAASSPDLVSLSPHLAPSRPCSPDLARSRPISAGQVRGRRLGGARRVRPDRGRDGRGRTDARGGARARFSPPELARSRLTPSDLSRSRLSSPDLAGPRRARASSSARASARWARPTAPTATRTPAG